MVKITSQESINFLVRGVRGSSNALEIVIDAKGVVVSEADAAIVKERLGGLVTVTPVTASDVREMVEEEIKEAEAAVEDAPAEEVTVEGDGETEEAAVAPEAKPAKGSKTK